MGICARASFDSCCLCCREGKGNGGEKEKKRKVRLNVRRFFVGREEGEEQADVQDEVDMIAEEGTHDEREYASGKGEN